MTVVWDWNGTLLNDVLICIESVNRLLARRSLPAMDLERYHRVFTFPVRKYYEIMGFDFEQERFEDVAVEYHDAYDELVSHANLHDDAAGVLERLHAFDVQQVVLSALEEHRLQRELDIRGLSRYLNGAFGLSDLDAVSKVERGRERLTAARCPVFDTVSQAADYILSL